MLLQLRDFIQRERMVSTQQLTREFQIDETALQPMLAIFLQKGVIQECQQNTACSSPCSRCTPRAPRFYRAVLA